MKFVNIAAILVAGLLIAAAIVLPIVLTLPKKERAQLVMTKGEENRLTI